MIKVLNIISDTNIGGAGRVILNYLKYFDKTEFDVSVALPQGSALKEEIEPYGVQVYEVDGMADKSLDFGVIRKLKALIRQVAPDIVHTHGSMSGRIAARQCGVRVLYTRHCVYPVSPKLQKGPLHWLYGKINEHYCDWIIAVSPAAKDNLTDSGISGDLVDVIMNGVEPLRTVSPEEKAAARVQYNIPEGLFTAGIMARIEEYKGHRLILEAARKLKADGRQFRILIGGTGGYEAECRRLIGEMELEDCVQMLGFVKDVALPMSLMDVQLNASYGTEASSLALMEGMSLSLATVASDYGGNPWLVTDGENGYLFPTGDSDGLYAALKKCMDDRENLEKMCRGARERFDREFTGKVFAGKVEDVYRKVMG